MKEPEISCPYCHKKMTLMKSLEFGKAVYDYYYECSDCFLELNIEDVFCSVCWSPYSFDSLGNCVCLKCEKTHA